MGDPRTKAAWRGAQSRDNREADAWARETPRLCKAGRGRSGAAPGVRHRPGGCGTPTPHPPSLLLFPRGIATTTTEWGPTQPARPPRERWDAGRRQPPPCPGTGKLRHGTTIATGRDTRWTARPQPPPGSHPDRPSSPRARRADRYGRHAAPEPASPDHPGPGPFAAATRSRCPEVRAWSV
ncbi:basic proline-rich protein-like [Manacus candei]|uniref:basic proline-rich protein-like n=1 Tax=Manacus candei TaxID=415023 RepID=UPI002227FD29|nr:basic proline-rich protein-like [Manacus candei]